MSSSKDKGMKILPKKWYAIYTYPRHEKRVEEELREKGIDVFLPQVKTKKQYSDRKKKVTEPLFKSYVFVNIVYGRRHQAVFDVNGIVGFVKSEGRPLTVRNKEIEAVKRLLKSNEELEVTNRRFAEGEKVRIDEGPMAGVEGKVIRLDGKTKLQVFIDQIGQGIVVQLHESRVKKLEFFV